MRYTDVREGAECDASGETDRMRRRIERYRRALRQSAQRSRQERQARIAAELAGAEKDRVMAAVCHDLRTPLNAIMAWAQLAGVAPVNSDELREALAPIELNVRSQSMLINDILDLAKSANGTLRITRELIDVRACVAAALDVLEPAAAAKAVRLASRQPADPVVVLGDPVRLQRMVWNLLTNALKFTPRSGDVGVELRTEGTNALLTVTDTGCGIAPQLLARIFDRFEQGNSDRGGIGLGLPIVRRLVETHGGTVTAYSAGEGLGAKFTVSLPLATSNEHAGPPEVLDPPVAQKCEAMHG